MTNISLSHPNPNCQRASPVTPTSFNLEPELDISIILLELRDNEIDSASHLAQEDQRQCRLNPLQPRNRRALPRSRLCKVSRQRGRHRHHALQAPTTTECSTPSQVRATSATCMARRRLFSPAIRHRATASRPRSQSTCRISRMVAPVPPATPGPVQRLGL